MQFYPATLVIAVVVIVVVGSNTPPTPSILPKLSDTLKAEDYSYPHDISGSPMPKYLAYRMVSGNRMKILIPRKFHVP
ncbi:hypothetical protein BDV26DRAFT_214425 [Aspergillus bertholletiae]|uniref:Secreted protein n=1 Tax=Aspergillus bertholletiae TaxID=1226010 RepID=A0A5N7B627_9EURO|nr:hypothetical protein BDV26DRAFT_214425 [Aspergillus bertholletiae]